MQYDVTQEYLELLKHGYTPEELLKRFSLYIFENGSCVAHNRRSERGITGLLEETNERKKYKKLVAEGVTWIKYKGRWALAGKCLTEGEKVMAYKKDGTASIEIIGKVVAKHRDGRLIAFPGQEYYDL